MREKHPGIYRIGGNLATRNLDRGKKVYGEKLLEVEGTEYRLWNPYRSKLAAAILKGLKEVPIKKGSRCLYLGAASGTTASHISDIAYDGAIYCVEFSARVLKELLDSCSTRKNIIPILADARRPAQYGALVQEVDVIYQDVAQPNQAEILLENSEYYLKEGGSVIVAIKARSIDSTRRPEKIFREETKKLKSRFKINEVVHLEPYHKDHALISARRK